MGEKIDIAVLKEGSDVYGKIIDSNWKDRFLVIEETKEDIEYKHIIHWDNIIKVIIATKLEVKRNFRI